MRERDACWDGRGRWKGAKEYRQKKSRIPFKERIKAEQRRKKSFFLSVLRCHKGKVPRIRMERKKKKSVKFLEMDQIIPFFKLSGWPGDGG